MSEPKPAPRPTCPVHPHVTLTMRDGKLGCSVCGARDAMHHEGDHKRKRRVRKGGAA